MMGLIREFGKTAAVDLRNPAALDLNEGRDFIEQRMHCQTDPVRVRASAGGPGARFGGQELGDLVGRGEAR
jgi:hypothetical protein